MSRAEKQRAAAQRAREPLQPSRKPDRLFLALCLFLAASVFLTFAGVFDHEFINFDDPEFVTSNPHVLRGLTGDGLVWAFQFGHGDYWHPLTWLSLMFDVTLFGRGPVGLHLMNVLLHAANTLLVFALLRQWTGALWRSLFVAALFGLHPLHVEPVAWVTARKDVLSTLFLLLTLWAYGQYVKVRGTRSEVRHGKDEVPHSNFELRSSKAAYFLALFLFVLGLMSKAMLITVPGILLLLDYWPLGRMADKTGGVSFARLRSLLIEKIPFLALSIASLLVTYWGQHRKELLVTDNFSLLTRLQNAFVAYERYLLKTFWPANLSIVYPHPGRWSSVEITFAVTLILGICLAAWLLRRKLPFGFVGWFWFVGTLVPVIGLTQGWTQFMADRFTYVPLIGLFMVMAWGLPEVLRRVTGAKHSPGIAGIVAIAACALLSVGQLRHWQNSGTLFRHALAAQGPNDLAYGNLGAYLDQQGQPDLALDCYQKAIQLGTRNPEVHNNLASASERRGDLATAIDHYNDALRLAPYDVRIRNNLGVALARSGKLNEAVDYLRATAQMAPNDAVTYRNLGTALSNLGRTTEAMDSYRKALQVDPDYAEAHNNLANLLSTEGAFDEATAHYRRAIELRPDFIKPYHGLGALLVRMGRFEAALAPFSQAVKLAPEDPELRGNLAAALAMSGKSSDAALQYAEVLRLQPGNVDARCNLARVLIQLGRRDEAAAHLKEALRIQPGHAAAREELEQLNGSKALDAKP